MSIPKDLLEILVCPQCKEGIVKIEMFIICNNCKLAYPILDDYIPDMTVEDAWTLEKAEKLNFKHELKL